MKRKLQEFILQNKGSCAYSGNSKTMYVTGGEKIELAVYRQFGAQELHQAGFKIVYS